jgi:two-component system, NtrC family, sensor kinase
MFKPVALQQTDRPSPYDKQARDAAIRMLKILAAASVVLPSLLFAFASILSYHAAQQLAHERIERSLDVMQEQALKVFQSMKLALDTIEAVVANRPAAALVADEAALHQRLVQIQKSLRPPGGCDARVTGASL